MLRELKLAHGEQRAIEIFQTEDPSKWPPWGCQMWGWEPKPRRGDKLSDHSVEGVFTGWDRAVTSGMKMAIMDWTSFPAVVVEKRTVTTGRCRETTFPGVAHKKRVEGIGLPTQEETLDPPSGVRIEEDDSGLKPRRPAAGAGEDDDDVGTPTFGKKRARRPEEEQQADAGATKKKLKTPPQLREYMKLYYKANKEKLKKRRLAKQLDEKKRQKVGWRFPAKMRQQQRSSSAPPKKPQRGVLKKTKRVAASYAAMAAEIGEEEPLDPEEVVNDVNDDEMTMAELVTCSRSGSCGTSWTRSAGSRPSTTRSSG